MSHSHPIVHGSLLRQLLINLWNLWCFLTQLNEIKAKYIQLEHDYLNLRTNTNKNMAEYLEGQAEAKLSQLHTQLVAIHSEISSKHVVSSNYRWKNKYISYIVSGPAVRDRQESSSYGFSPAWFRPHKVIVCIASNLWIKISTKRSVRITLTSQPWN